MAQVRFIGAEPHTVPELGDRLIQPDEIVTVPDSRWDGYVCQPHLWESVEEPPAPAPEPEPPAPAPEPEPPAQDQPAAEPPAAEPTSPAPAKKTAAKAAPKGAEV